MRHYRKTLTFDVPSRRGFIDIPLQVEQAMSKSGGKLNFETWKLFYGEFDGWRNKRVLIKLQENRMIPNEQTAGICGLFCGECPMYPVQCHGCLSDKLAPHCRTCPNGFRECAGARGVTWCFECADFPCARLENFLDTHWENGISHHAGVIENLKRMQAMGVAAWVNEKTEKTSCPHCGSIKPWNRHKCLCQK